MSAAALHISAPTSTRVHPVAQGGIDAKMGAKKIAMKKQRPVTQEVRPVVPPSEIPAPLSMKADTGGVPKREPIEMVTASTI